VQQRKGTLPLILHRLSHRFSRYHTVSHIDLHGATNEKFSQKSRDVPSLAQAYGEMQRIPSVWPPSELATHPTRETHADDIMAIIDEKQQITEWMGKRMHWPDIVTLAGIRQVPDHSTPKYLKWSSDAIKGLTYLMTGKGPQRQ